MSPNQNMSGYYIEDTLLLNFLITRYSEMLGTDKPRLVPVWAGLGMVALHQNRQLANAFETLISSPSYTAEEALTSSIDLFWAELHRLEAADPADYVEKKIERRLLSPRTARKFLFWAWREGRKMRKEREFRFYPIWEVVSWLGLNSDEYNIEFEKRCRFSESPMEVKLEEGLEVIKAAIFGRRIDSTSSQQDMLKTGTRMNC